MKVMIICAPGLEECEALLTYDLLFRAKIETHLIGLDKEILSSHNVKFVTHYTFSEINIKDYDALVLPGGMPGTLNLEKSDFVQKTINYFMDKNKLIAAVCAAPSILIHKGLLKDNEFTCYPGFENGLKRKDVKAYQYKNIITGVGLGGTIDFASLIISYLKDETSSKEILSKIQY